MYTSALPDQPDVTCAAVMTKPGVKYMPVPEYSPSLIFAATAHIIGVSVRPAPAEINGSWTKLMPTHKASSSFFGFIEERIDFTCRFAMALGHALRLSSSLMHAL